MDYNDLIEDWIVYLKDKGIASHQSNKDGSLNYLRGPTKSDIVSFLSNNGIPREDIRSALQTVGEPADTITAQISPAINKLQSPEENPEIDNDNTGASTISIEPGKVIEFPGIKDLKFQWAGQQWKLINPKSGKSSKIANREISKVLTQLATGKEPAMHELLKARKKIGLFSSKHPRENKLIEAFSDATYSEEQIESIFKTLLNSPTSIVHTPAEKTEDDKIDEINAIKHAIRNSFDDTQRKALWRILSNA